MQRIRSFQAMNAAKARCKVRDLQAWGDPFQVWIRGKQTLELIDPLFVRVAIGITNNSVMAMVDATALESPRSIHEKMGSVSGVYRRLASNW